MRRGIIPAVSMVIMAVVSTGCGTPYLDTKATPGADSWARIFLARGESAIAALKDMLRSAPPGDILDLQTAITLETVRIPAGKVSDRRSFQQEADRLEHLIARQGRETPTDSAVLAYLANLANGQSASASYLSQAEEEAVLKLCGPAHEVLAHAYDQDEGLAQRLLRQSCFTWLIGDSEKSLGLYNRATNGHRLGTGGAGDNGFETFLIRLEDETGIDLQAHRERLGGGPGPELPEAGYKVAPKATGVRQLSSSSVHRSFAESIQQ